MNMVYVLIIVSGIGYSGTMPVSMQEFNNRESCMKALQSTLDLIQPQPSRYIKGICVEKGNSREG